VIQYPALTSINVPNLTTCGAITLNQTGGIDINLPTLTTIGGDLFVAGPGESMTAPALATMTGALVLHSGASLQAPSLSGQTSSILIEAGASVFAPNLASAAGSVTIHAAGASVDLSGLISTGDLDLESDTLDQLHLDSLSTVNGAFKVYSTTAPSVTFPSLTTIAGPGIGGDVVTITMQQGVASFPALQTINQAPQGSCNFTIKVAGTFSAPLLTTIDAQCGVSIDAGGLDLSSLQVSNKAILFTGAMATIDLPELTTAPQLTIGYGIPCLIVNVPNLTQLTAPKYLGGYISIGAAPLFPKCRADALIAQGNGSEQCPPYAAGPCP